MRTPQPPPGPVWAPSGPKHAQELPDRLIAAVAATQHGLVTTTQLLNLGLTRKMIKTRARAGTLHRVHRGVYSVGTAPTTRESHWLAAVLACGPDALLAYTGAGALWDIRASAATLIDVISPTRAGRARDGIRVHRAANLTDADRAVRKGIPVTALPRTIIDLATVLNHDALEYTIHRAESKRLVTVGELHEALARLRGHPGTGQVRAIVGDPWHALEARTRGRKERRFLAICREHGIEPPRVNEWIGLPIASGGFEVDFHWPERGLVVEIDERASHATVRAFRNDRARDRLLGDAGWRVIRFAEEELSAGAAVAEAVVRALRP